MDHEWIDITLHVLAGIVLAGYSLLAIWTGLARRPRWPYRYAILVAAIALWIPIYGREVIIFLLCHAGVVLGTLVAVRVLVLLMYQSRSAAPSPTAHAPDLRSIASEADDDRGTAQNGLAETSVSSTTDPSHEVPSSPSPQISLRGLLYATALMAIAFAIGRFSAPEVDNTAGEVLPLRVLSLSAVTLLTALLVLAPGGRIWRSTYLFLYLALGGAPLVFMWNQKKPWFTELSSNIWDKNVAFDQVFSAVIAVFLLVVLLCWRNFFRGRSEDRRPASGIVGAGPRSSGRILKWTRRGVAAVCLLLVVPPAYIYFRMALPPAAPATPESAPNGYVMLQKIASKVEAVVNPAVEDEDTEDRTLEDYDKRLAAFAREHAAIVDEVQAALEQPLYVPLDDSSITDVNRIRPFFELRRCLAAIAEDAADEDRMDDVAETGALLIRVGRAIGDGGLPLEYFVGNGFEDLGRGILSRYRIRFQERQKQHVFSQLQEVCSARETLDEIVARERIYMLRVDNWQLRLLAIADEWTGGAYLGGPRFREVWTEQLAYDRLLLTTFAVELFRDRHDEVPPELSDLVPEYLSEVPEDPFGPGQLVYQRLGSADYLLYSRGRNRVDDGGVIYVEGGDAEIVAGPVAVAESRSQLEAGILPLDVDKSQEEGDLFLDFDEWYRISEEQLKRLDEQWRQELQDDAALPSESASVEPAEDEE
ncbi:MAG: hypothetical protein DWQ31_02655 [Planctomycetota bacterium]|nr:MAG: hypothetical protein DWQ31_02655 [Planctomycetota bacterium]REJ95755.1 MAG: hypothetical protein DWQ35_05740 [Planctomycetota bacterium]